MTYFSLEHMSSISPGEPRIIRIGYEGLKHVYDYADIDHCLFMLQHLGEFQEKYNLPTGDYDTSELTRGLPIESPSVGEKMRVLPDKAFDKFLVHCYETGTIDWRNLPVSI